MNNIIYNIHISASLCRGTHAGPVYTKYVNNIYVVIFSATSGYRDRFRPLGV